MKYSAFKEAPHDFNPTVEASGCYCHCQGKVLFLKRHPEKPQGNTWCIPGGKKEEGENPRMTVIREIREEVGLNIDDDNLEMLEKMYMRLPHVEYVYHMFFKSFSTFPTIDLALDEHLELKWVSIEEALELPLIAGGIEALSYYKERIGRE